MSFDSVSKPAGTVPRTLADWLLGVLGVGGAVASAGFATYMITVGPGAPNPHGSGYFTVFAHFDRRPQFAQLHEDVQRPVDDRPAPAHRPPETPLVASADAGTIDFTPTGSVAMSAAPVPVADRSGPWPDGAPALDGFVLRDVFDGKALVEGRHRMSLVTPGTLLEGAGQVLSIERRRDDWVVVTQEGVIGGGARGR